MLPTALTTDLREARFWPAYRYPTLEEHLPRRQAASERFVIGLIASSENHRLNHRVWFLNTVTRSSIKSLSLGAVATELHVTPASGVVPASIQK